MASLDLTSELLAMINNVTLAPDERAASVALLYPLLTHFDMDQAALCELKEKEILPLFAMDRTKKILPKDSELWLSHTLMGKALTKMEPAVHADGVSVEKSVPQSISEYSLKNVVCIPLSRDPDRVIYLASQRNPLRRYGAEELAAFKIASTAAHLALRQHENFQELKSQNEKLQSALKSQQSAYLFASPAMKIVMEEVSRLAPFDISIILQGESGVGKEVLAREIHRMSGRQGAFVAINCANLTETLLESELFGFARGAFTGAFAAKKGLLQEADGGTFFLDEIAELPASLQAKLLRVLQEKQIRPLGTNKDIPVDIRVLAASHGDLRVAVHERRFREDLYYRLQQMTIHIPPLRERVEDIELLSHHFITKFSAEFQLPLKSWSQEAKEKLKAQGWRGNVRELQNVCRMAVILSRGAEIQAEDIRLTEPIAAAQLPSKPPALDVPTGGLKEMSRRFELETIQRLLEEPNQTQSTVASRLNISVRTLQRILNKEGDLPDAVEVPPPHPSLSH